MKFIKSILKSFICASVIISVCSLYGCSINKKKYDDIKVSFLKVGKADAIVINTVSHTVLIDAANSGDGKDIYDFCSNQGCDELDYFILTHFDQDHVGGAKAVISKFSNVKNILEPDYSETSDEYIKYEKAVSEKNYTRTKVKKELTFKLDDAVFTVYPGLNQTYQIANNYSLVITMVYGEKSFIFAGDAENERLSEIMEQIPQRKGGYDLVKIPHHGLSEKKTDNFIEFLKPSMAVICCSRKEPPDDKVINILEKNKVDTYFTYNGTITFACDGYSIIPGEQSDEG